MADPTEVLVDVWVSPPPPLACTPAAEAGGPWALCGGVDHDVVVQQGGSIWFNPPRATCRASGATRPGPGMECRTTPACVQAGRSHLVAERLLWRAMGACGQL